MSTNSILLKLNATADILGGEMFFADENGYDPIYSENGNLSPNGMYIRLRGSDGSMAYISAFEIDNILTAISALNIKADTLQTLIDDKVTNTEFELLKSDLDTKADLSRVTALENTYSNKVDKTAIDELIEVINAKSDQSVVDSLKEELEKKGSKSDIVRLFAEIENRATVAEINSIKSDIITLRNAVKSVSDAGTIATLTSQIEALNAALQTKVTASDLNVITYNINNLKNDVNDLESKLYTAKADIDTKASKTELKENLITLKGSLVQLSNKLDSKANMSDVATKANKDAVNALTAKVTELNKALSKINEVATAKYNDIYTKINSKADNKTTKDALDKLANETASNVKLEDYEIDKQNLTRRVTEVEENYENDYKLLRDSITTITCEINNAIANLQVTDNDFSNELEEHSNILALLQSSTNDNTEKIKFPWVRVLTTKEYERLMKYDPTLNYYSAYYKYPNIIYFIVDYGKPKAVYIGDIQIAKAEKTGSVGFAYTFPISF